jgi:hypothetical protein
VKTLKFKPHLAELILKGEKTVTWRLFDDKDLKVGDELELVNKEIMQKFAEAKIVGVREKKLGEIKEGDYEGHEKYESMEAMIGEFKKFYGDRVDNNTLVKIIEFKLCTLNAWAVLSKKKNRKVLR